MKNCYQRIEYLGYYEIIGGIFGISLVFLSVYDKLNSDGFFIFSLLLFVTLCGISIYSGILLIQKKYLKGLNLSFLAQATQVISFVLFGYIFDFAIGIYFRITTELTNDTIVGLDFGFANWNLSRSANPDIIELNINVVAIILLLLIAKSANQIKAELNK
ncbi:hypothetical protein [Croceibacter atlanticus]|jgi:hypothetical protein|uniref:Uncharacterized protein n=1 Tax=Croceibacter atlanticus (strain ATCC BAA-628 / JCM 21780 / CIP 108009 / IAM 15332 / KCTC 12090 / HTCC2559) TaxID=216432 RepID=A3U8A3_CROAH|nr:hypothetical protein [Croceibacter atlanticus]EAP88470.1 hypothetical protein CA2559_06905 [Croceibacter atlanticus HTCC2559]MBW4969396.1 hypothetical protein [Croceibacter atlanticus]